MALIKYISRPVPSGDLKRFISEEFRFVERSQSNTIDFLDEEPVWIAPTLLNSWVDFGGTFAQASYYKDQFARVHLKGVVKNGTADTIFTLPVGYRPAERHVFATIAGGDTLGRLDVDPDGSVVRQAGNNAYFCMSISFLAEG